MATNFFSAVILHKVGRSARIWFRTKTSIQSVTDFYLTRWNSNKLDEQHRLNMTLGRNTDVNVE